MSKKLLNIKDDDLYLSIQVHAKTHRSDANTFINQAMEEKAARDGVKMISRNGVNDVEKQEQTETFDLEENLNDADFDDVPDTESVTF